VNLKTHLHLWPRLRMRGTVPSHPACLHCVHKNIVIINITNIIICNIFTGYLQLYVWKKLCSSGEFLQLFCDYNIYIYYTYIYCIYYIYNIYYYFPWETFCTLTLALSEVRVQCSEWLFTELLDVVLYQFVAQIFSEWFSDVSTCPCYYRRQFYFYNTHTLYFYCKLFVF
jgi:hypothetical protein